VSRARLMPTGGVDAAGDSIQSWFDDGAACLDIRSELIAKGRGAAGDFGVISQKGGW